MKVKRMRKGLSLLLMAAMLLVLVPAAAFAAAPEAPTATPGAGEIVAGTTVTFQCATEGATISYRCSADGGTTWTNWTDGDSYAVDADVKVEVKATNTDGESPVSTFAYTALATPAIPTPDIAPGLVARGTTVTFSSTEGADITIDDGTIPVTESTYVVNDNVTLTVTASKDGKVSTANFTYTVKDTVAAARAACDETNPGLSFVIEGTLTSNAFNYTDEQLAAATDCRAFNNFLYVQDATAGIRCVRSAIDTETNQLVGAKVRVNGTTDVVNGEPVLKVTSLEVLEASTAESVTAITPTTTVPASVLNDQTASGAQGKLVAVSGTVVEVKEVSGLIESVTLKDSNDDMARLYIDPSITTATPIACCVPGASIVAAGIAAYDESYTGTDGLKAFLRIRDRADIVCKPAKPTADVAAGEVDSGTAVTFATTTEGATIQISNDGTNWTTGSDMVVDDDVTVQVKAKLGTAESEVASFAYTIKTTTPEKPATPTASVSSGSAVASGTTVTFATTTAGATLSYSTDNGTTWTEGSSITVTAATTVKVKATKDSTDSDEATFTYTITAAPAKPTATPDGGEAELGTTVTFACATEGAVISYSTDNGTTWTEGSSFVLDRDRTIQLKAVKDGQTTMGDPVSFKTYVLLNANGGKVDETLVYTADGSLPELPMPSQRDGYVFGGWFDSETGGNQMIQGDSPLRNMTLYAHWYEITSSVSEGAVVPTALTGTYSSVDAMRNTMLKTVQRRLGTTAVKGSKLYEVSVQYYDNDLGAWLPIQASQFPTAGVKVAIGIPSGASGTDRFVALHLFGEDCNGHKAGEGEMPTITANGGVLSLTVHGTSPLLLVWTATGSGSGTTPRTGDESNLTLWGGMMIASFTAMLGAPVILRRKKV